MNNKHAMSDDEAQKLIAFIKRRCQGIEGNFDYFMNPSEVCEIVESTLIGLGYDPYWVVGPFSQMLKNAVEAHRHSVLERKYNEGPG